MHMGLAGAFVAMLFIGLLALIIIGSWDVIVAEFQGVGKGNAYYQRADELPEKEATVDIELYMGEKCANCTFFDGYDVCMHRQQFGTMIQNSVEYCKFNNRFKQK